MSTLETRLTHVEAELAVRNTIARYGLAADCGDIETALACHTHDAVYIVSNPDAGRDVRNGDDLILQGHSAIADMLGSNRHQSLLPHCAHTVGPLLVSISGATGDVLGYSRVYDMRDDNPHLMRLAFNRWTMRKTDHTWKIARRESRVMGEAAAQDMLKTALGGVGAQ